MDRTEWMFKVEVNVKHKIDGKSEWRWIPRDIEDVAKTDQARCVHCQGEVRLHQGPKVKWHAEHLHKEDALKCPGSPAGKEKKLYPHGRKDKVSR